MKTSTAMSHKEAATSFMRLVATGNVGEAYERYVGSNFRHHNPFFRGDAESLKLAMEKTRLNIATKYLKFSTFLRTAIWWQFTHVFVKVLTTAAEPWFTFLGSRETASSSFGTLDNLYPKIHQTKMGCFE